MAGGQKKKSSSSKSKKNKSRKSNSNGAPKKPVPLEEVLSQAENAMEMSDIDTALQLFSYAAGVLRSKVHSSSADGSINTDTNSCDQDKATLSTVLGKMGELKASNGDVEGARTDFLDAIELLGPTSTTTADAEDGKMMAIEEGECYVGVAQSSESRASLHLYLGQLSSGTEALESFSVGVSELERAVTILEHICASSGDGTNDIDMEDGGDMSVGNLKQSLVETR